MVPFSLTYSIGFKRHMRILGLRCLILSTVLILSVPNAQAGPEVDMAYWIDDSDRAGVLEVAEQLFQGQFRQFDRTLAEGYIPHPIWIALTLGPGNPEEGDWVVRIRPPWHDRIEFFQSPSESEASSLLGSKIDSLITDGDPLTFDFHVPQQSIQQTVFIRVITVHSLLLDVEVLNQVQASRADRNNALFFGFYFSFLCAALFWSLITWLSDRERVLGAFCAQLVLSIAYAACMFGIARLLLPEGMPSSNIDAWTNVLIIAYPMSVIWFYRELYRDYGLRVWPRRVIDAIVVSSGICLLVLFFGETQQALRLNAIIITLSGFWLLACPWIFLDPSKDKSPDRLALWVMRGVVSLILLFAFAGVVRTLGLGSQDGVIINGFLLHAFVLAVVMPIALQYRAHQRSSGLIASESRALQKAEDEQRYREQLQQFMHMFSHEVRTPLMVANIAIEQGVNDPELAMQGAGAISDINTLVSRCLQTDQIESRAFPLSMERFFLKETLQEMATQCAPVERFSWSGDQGIKVFADRWVSGIIFANLIENAMKYGLADQPIHIGIEQQSDQSAAVRVSNAVDGRGSFDVDQVFDKFYRSDYAKRKSGAGLGLYLARALAEMQGGSLECSVDKKTQVTFIWTIR